MVLQDNKADLALFLSNCLTDHSPSDQTVAVAGGFTKAMVGKLSDPKLDLAMLEADHEETDRHLILHCIHSHMGSMVVSVRDTDVLVLLLAHCGELGYTTLLKKPGTSEHPKFIPVCDIRRQLTVEQVSSILVFRAVAACDSVSFAQWSQQEDGLACVPASSQQLELSGKGPFH